MKPTSSASRHVVPSTKWRDKLIAVASGVVVLGFVLYAVFSLGRLANSTGWTQGVIVGKEFVARPETQVTFGQGGVHSRSLAGDYIFQVKVPTENGKVYRVKVSASAYRSCQEGESYAFLR